ncbi:MAG: hypothetical protein ACK4NQ_00135 [Fimbriimonadaceae bacterium]
MKPYHWVLIAVGLLLLVFVWPTPYHLYRCKDAYENDQLCRVNRLSGKVQSATGMGWR